MLGLHANGVPRRRKLAALSRLLTSPLHVQAIALFGTDFSLIEKMFPSRQRKALKFKLRREYRDNPQNVDAALSGKDCGATSYQEVVTALQRVSDHPTLTTIILATALQVRRLQTCCAGLAKGAHAQHLETEERSGQLI